MSERKKKGSKEELVTSQGKINKYGFIHISRRHLKALGLTLSEDKRKTLDEDVPVKIQIEPKKRRILITLDASHLPSFLACENEPLSLGETDLEKGVIRIYLTRDYEGNSADVKFLGKLITHELLHILLPYAPEWVISELAGV